MTLVLAALVVADVVLVMRGDFWAAIGELFATPTIALLIYGMLTAAAIVHELGHAAACRYGGATPGEIGFGLYLVFPAFYTDVTDSYRLGRVGRVRTDLGGLHFNALTVLVLAAAYVATGSGVLLLTALVLQFQMLQQLIPVVRFDGYYVLSDLAGVPDLFARVGPVLRSLRPGHPVDPRVTELRPRSRRFVTGWVVVVVPLLVGAFAWAIWYLPEFVERGRDGVRLQQLVFDLAWDRRDWAVMALAVVSIALLLLPILGVLLALWRVAVSLFLLVRSRLAARPPEAYEPSVLPDPPRVVSAADFTDEVMYAAPAPVPTQGWRGAVYRGSGHVLNPGPSLPEQRRRELEHRLRTPIDGSRRVVVMSRKGGVGKTTITLALGSTFALLRGDRVIAVDANPDAGNLAHRVAPPHDRTVTDVLRDLDLITTYAALRRYTSQGVESRLEVLASDDDPRHRDGPGTRRLPPADRAARPLLQPDPARHRHRHPRQRQPGPAHRGRPGRAGGAGRAGRRAGRGADAGLDGPARVRRPRRPDGRRGQRRAARERAAGADAAALREAVRPRRDRPVGRRPRARRADRHVLAAPSYA